MNSKDVLELIGQQQESDILDFKERFHENKAELLHDILCLANNTKFQDAYLVFGIIDSGQTVGVENNQKRLNSADIQGFLHDNRLKFFNNEVPEIEVFSFQYSGHEIDVLQIKSTFKLPYFLIEHYQDDKKTVRSGHIYSRTDDRNTPIDQFASPSDVETLWKKRFFLLEKPYDKFLIYLNDLSNWKIEQRQNDKIVRFFYEPEPTFIVEKTIDFEDKDSLPYYQAQPYGLTSIYRGNYRCIANQVVIESGDIYYIDNTNSVFPETKYYPFQNTPSDNLVLSMDYYLENSISFKLLSLFNQNKNSYSNLGLDLFLNQTLIFSSQIEANEFINEVEKNIQGVIKKVEESSKINFKDAPYDRRKHDIFRIHTGRVLKDMHSNLQLQGLDNND